MSLFFSVAEWRIVELLNSVLKKLIYAYVNEMWEILRSGCLALH